MDVKCPYCNNYFLVRQYDDNVGSLKYKCINCNTYFTESELFGSKSNTAKVFSTPIPKNVMKTFEVKKVELTDECINKLAAAIAKELKGDK